MSSKYLTILKALELGHSFTFRDGPRLYRDPDEEEFKIITEVGVGENWLISVNDFIAACEVIPEQVIQELEEDIFMEVNDDITLDGGFGDYLVDVRKSS